MEKKKRVDLMMSNPVGKNSKQEILKSVNEIGRCSSSTILKTENDRIGSARVLM